MHKKWINAFIYIIRFPNNKVYIGRWTGSFNKLLKRYQYCKDKDRYVSRAIAKYGYENIVINIVENFDIITNDELNDKEIEYIKFYDSVNPKKGYNIRKGGNGHPMTISGRQAISEKAKIRFKDKTNHPLYGKKFSIESRQKMSKSRKGKYLGKNNALWKDYLNQDELKQLIIEGKSILEIAKIASTCQAKIEDSLFVYYGTKSLVETRKIFQNEIDQLYYPDKNEFEQLILDNNTTRSFKKIGYPQVYLTNCLLHYYGTDSLPEVKYLLGVENCCFSKLHISIIEKYKQELENNGFKILNDKDITKWEDFFEIQCRNNHITKIKLNYLNNKYQCYQCVLRNNNINNLEKLKQEMLAESCILLYMDDLEKLVCSSDKFQGQSKTKINYICSSGHQREVLWKTWSNGARCGQCSLLYSQEQLRLHHKLFVESAIETLTNEMLAEGYKLLPNQIYINCTTKLKYVCANGHEKETSWNAWHRGYRCVHCNHKSKKMKNN